MFELRGSLLSLVALTLLLDASVAQRGPLKVEYQWRYLNFTWPSAQAYNQASANGEYVPKNNAMAGIKLWKDRLYLTIPRWKFGVPATLLSLPLNHENGEDKATPLLQPFPNWEMQRVGDCSALQFVQSMEIDPKGRMWVIDTGRVGTLEDHPKNLCPARLVVFDLEANNKILLNYVFPEDVVKRNTVYLNDLVLDHEDGGWAYITDTDDTLPGIVVFSLNDRASWKVTHESMYATAVEFRVKFDGTKVDTPLNVDPIALSPASTEGHRTLYYAPLSSFEIFSIPTHALKQRDIDVNEYVKKFGEKSSQSDGMMMSADGRLYYGQLSENSVYEWNTQVNRPFKRTPKQLFNDDQLMQWPDTFAIDEEGWLWCVSNRLQRFLADKLETNYFNFRVLKLTKLTVRNYQYYYNGSSPAIPNL